MNFSEKVNDEDELNPWLETDYFIFKFNNDKK